MATLVIGRLFRRRTYTLERARALTARFLRQHRDAMADTVRARDSRRHEEENQAGRSPDMADPTRPTAADQYAVYSAFLAGHAYSLCSPLLPQTGDKNEGIEFFLTVLIAGLGIDLATAGDWFVESANAAPRTDDGRLLGEDDFDEFSDVQRRSFRLWKIAARDAGVIVRAFADGSTTIDLSNHDFGHLVEWLENPAQTDGERC